MTKKPPRILLRELIERSGLSQTEIAKRAGYNHTSSVNRFLREDIQGDRYIPHDTMHKLAPVLLHMGNPPITAADILACSGPPAIARARVQAFETVVEDGNGLLAIKYRIEGDVYIPADTARVYGASRLGASRAYSVSAQFAVAVTDGDVDAGPVGTQYQCVTTNAVQGPIEGRRVVYGRMHKDGELMTVGIGRVVRVDQRTGSVAVDTAPIAESIRVLGVVLGVYTPET